MYECRAVPRLQRITNGELVAASTVGDHHHEWDHTLHSGTAYRDHPILRACSAQLRHPREWVAPSKRGCSHTLRMSHARSPCLVFHHAHYEYEYGNAPPRGSEARATHYDIVRSRHIIHHGSAPNRISGYLVRPCISQLNCIMLCYEHTNSIAIVTSY